MPFYKMPDKWEEPEGGIKYPAAEFHQRIAGPMQHLESELHGTEYMKLLNTITFIELDRILNGCEN